MPKWQGVQAHQGGVAEPPASAVASRTHSAHVRPLAGYSRVKLATHRETGQQYAVKIIPLPKRERGVAGSRAVLGELQMASCGGHAAPDGASAAFRLPPLLLLLANEVRSIDAPSQYLFQWATLPPCCPVLCAAGQSVNKYLSNRGAIMKVGPPQPLAVCWVGALLGTTPHLQKAAD